jgi:cardiolipin synthase A/B
MANASILPATVGVKFKIDGHDLRLLHEPDDRLAAIIALIEAAHHSVMFSIYMFHSDKSGQKVRAALIAAARRGVKVVLLIDSFGSSVVADSFFKPIAEAGGQYHYFSSRWRLSYFIRNHQKLLIIDDRHALVGGYNISDQYFGKSGATSWEDIGIVLSGPQVASMGDYLRQLVDLSDDGGVKLLALRKLIRSWQPGTGPIQWLVGGPTNRISPWALALKRDLQKASQADLVAAYFSPSQTVLRRIAGVARRGGSVRMIMAGRSDNGATIAAARILYGYLLKRHVSICEFQPLLLHTKLLVIDDAVYIGSANLDIRSLFINKEVMLRIEDNILAKHLRRYVRGLEAHSLPQDAEQHRKRMGPFTRIRATLAYLLVNSLDYNIGRRIRFGMRKLLPGNE